ncbi:MAG: polysaccharide deacetylase family protein [Epulopiscium sp.]|nr:polysaccharide deacetylase family protein [Candidatus Epulonipiscium sp.]
MKKIIKCFPGGKHKVLTMSYDDGKIADRRLVEIFNHYGIKGTFHINSGLLGETDRLTEEEVVELYRGHEVSVHTVTHPTLARCFKEEIVQQIYEDRRMLESLFGYPIRGMSYPNGSYNQQILDMLPHLGIEYARTVGSSKNFEMPRNFHEWKATCHHNQDLIDLGKTFVELHKKQYFYMMYVWGHSYEFDNDNNWGLIEEFCKLVGKREDIWYATNIEIVDYLHVLENLRFTIERDKVINPSAMSAWLQVDGKIIKVNSGITAL